MTNDIEHRVKTFTVADIMSAEPCKGYTEACVSALWAGREALTARQIAALDIPVVDRMWAVIGVCLDDRQRRLLACDCADEALSRIAEPDPRSVASVGVARRYATGDATLRELDAAWAAAWDAACAAWDARAAACAAWDARAAAGATACAACAAWDAWDACATACAAVRAAVRAAVSDAVRAAVSDAARSAVWERYLSWAVEYAEGEKS